MTLGALIDIGMPQKTLKEDLEKLKLPCTVNISRVMRMGISARQVTVKAGPGKTADHHRSFSDIEKIIKRSSLKSNIKDRSIDIFLRLAKAEARIHRRKVSDIHFHEVGAIDSIVDIVGSVIGFDYLGIEKFYSSDVPIGKGFLKCEHGILPVPAPATLALLKDVPVYSSGTNAEMVTPTGAAILTGFSESFGNMPPMKISATGYGAGTRQTGTTPNLLRLIAGESALTLKTDSVVVLETNIDDMNPEWSGFLMEQLFEAGALDVMLIPVYMKKNRPGIIVQTICTDEKRSELTQLMFAESTTAGIRTYRMQRSLLARSVRQIKTKFGMITVKMFEGVRGRSITPEYEECRKVAKKKNVPIREVYEEVIRKAGK